MEKETNNKEKVIKAYKGFNKDMTCRNFQYEVGKTYEHDGDVELCSKGFHACENPFYVLDFYGDIDGKYCEVEQYGKTNSDGKKTVSSKIKINAEIGFVGLFKFGVEWLKEITNPKKVIESTKKINNKSNINSYNDYAQIGSSGYYAKIGSSGYAAQICSSGNSAQIGSSGYYAQIGSSGGYTQIGSSGYAAQIGSSGYDAQIGSSGDAAQICSSGDSAKIGSSGYYAQIGSSGGFAHIGSSGDAAHICSSGGYAKIYSTGEDSVICCAGFNSCVKAKAGSWITLSEWKYDESKQRKVPVCVKTEYVDGEKIKEDTWYKLENGRFIEVR